MIRLYNITKNLHLLSNNVNLRFNVDMTRYHPYLKKAGSSSIFIKIERKEQDTISFWKNIYLFANEYNLPVRIFGGFTNTYFTEKGFDGITIQYKVINNSIKFTKDKIITPASLPLSILVQKASQKGFDLSFLSSIPGTVGGAIVGNSGRSKTLENIGDCVVGVKVFNLLSGHEYIINVKNSKEFFMQRNSKIKEANKNYTEYVVREVILEPNKIAPDEAKMKVQKRKEERIKKNIEAKDSAGSFWSNVLYRDQVKLDLLFRDLLRETDLINLNIGGAYYSKDHCFLKTAENTTDRDVACLLYQTKNELKKYNVEFMNEVEIIWNTGVISVNDFIRKFLLKNGLVTPLRTDLDYLKLNLLQP